MQKYRQISVSLILTEGTQGRSASLLLGLAFTWCAFLWWKSEFLLRGSMQYRHPKVSGKTKGEGILANRKIRNNFTYPLSYKEKGYSPTTDIFLRAYYLVFARCFSGNTEIPRGIRHSLSLGEIHSVVNKNDNLQDKNLSMHMLCDKWQQYGSITLLRFRQISLTNIRGIPLPQDMLLLGAYRKDRNLIAQSNFHVCTYMHNDIIDPGCELSAEAVVKPDGSLHLAARFPSSSRSHRKNPKEPTAPGLWL